MLSTMILVPGNALAQTVLDRVDPGLAERETRKNEAPRQNVEASVTSTESDDEVRSDASIVVGAIRIEGATTIPLSEFSSVIDRYMGAELDAKGLKSLARAIADVARAQGFAFATAWIEPQSGSMGLVRVRIDEGRIDAVRIDGAKNRAAIRILNGLVTGAPVTSAQAERALLLVADIPGVSLNASRYERIGNQGVLRVTLSEEKFVGRAHIDNRGTSVVGPVRTRLGLDMRGLITDGDELTVQTVAAPINQELGYISASYSVKLGYSGMSAYASTSYGRTRPGGQLTGLGLRGESFDATLGLSYPLVRSRAASLWTFVEGRYAQNTQNRNGIIIRDDQLATFTTGFRGNTRFLGGRLAGSISATHGLPILGATGANDPLASRLDGSGKFAKVNFYADWTRQLYGPVSMRLAATGQIASRPLLAAEEFGVGGANIGRGYDYYERSGDQGISGVGELRYNLPVPHNDLVRSAQLYGFADAGMTDNLGITDDRNTLYSAGGGVRLGLFKNADALIEAAVPLNTIRFDGGDRDPRISASFAITF
jgi:hemolysin activation/secretion protein